MKNRHSERNQMLARQYCRTMRRGSFEQGVLAYHDYSKVHPDELSWWDDVQFIHGRMHVKIAWSHPRQIYEDQLEEAAAKAVDHLYRKIEGDLFDNATKNHKKTGRSRKKVVSYTLAKRLAAEEWCTALNAEAARLSEEADFSVIPSLKITQRPWCRLVEIVAPIEVRTLQELHDLVNLVRRILKGETTLVNEFPGYVYGKPQWVSEKSYSDQIHQ